MKYTISLTENKDFRRIYAKAKSTATPVVAVYFRKNRLGLNRLGITVSTKVGKAVVRNKIRRRLKEVYRLNEARLKMGHDIVIVSRKRGAQASYRELELGLVKSLTSLGLITQ